MLDSVDGGTTRIGDVAVRPFNVEHRGAVKIFGQLVCIPAVGYQLICRRECIVVSGDSGPCERLQQKVKGSDLAVLEATRRRVASPTTHLTVAEARRMGETADNFMFVHRY